MTARTTAKEPAKKPVAADVPEDNTTADDAATTEAKDTDTADAAAITEPVDNATRDGDAETAKEVYFIEVVAKKRGVQKINLRDDASADDDANIDHAVPIGTRLKAVEDLGEWTRLTHGLYIMSKFVKKL